MRRLRIEVLVIFVLKELIYTLQKLLLYELHSNVTTLHLYS